jgi:serine/threonine protein kinase
METQEQETPTLLFANRAQPASPLAATPLLPPEGRAFLDCMVRLNLLSARAAQEFLEHTTSELSKYTDAELLGHDLVEAKLLTPFQLKRLLGGNTHGMVLGNYRLRDRIGGGAMGEVFLAEHIFMKRRVAIKVLPIDEECSYSVLERFYSEIQVLSELQHPNIVTAHDAGRLPGPHPSMPDILYLVMEYVPGGDLQTYITKNGPATMTKACSWVYQAARGLQQAHDRKLVHRDIKPSNLLLTQKQEVKLVDFGLVRQFSSRLTDPHSILGTVEYMSPEQSRDPSAVSSQSDIFGLGATLFFLLTKEAPYPRVRTLAEGLRQLREGRPRPIRALRADLPNELERLLDRMLDPVLTQRPSMPLTVMHALTPFLEPGVK